MFQSQKARKKGQGQSGAPRPLGGSEHGHAEEGFLPTMLQSTGLVSKPNLLVPWTKERIMNRVEIRMSEFKGRCLHTVDAVSRGDIIFIEKPLLVANMDHDETLFNEIQAALDSQDLWHITTLPAKYYFSSLMAMTTLGSTDADAFSKKWYPEDSVDADPVEAVLKKLCPSVPQNIDPHDWNVATLRVTYNGFLPPGSPEGYDYGFVVFEITSFISHSCDPTCCRVWVTDEAGEVAGHAYIANRDLPAGGELTFSYIGDQDCYADTASRREWLSLWQFTCGCPRCSAEADTTRGFTCPECSGDIFFHPEKGAFVSHCECGRRISMSDTREFLKEEAFIQDIIGENDNAVDFLEVPRATLDAGLEQGHRMRQHWMVEKLYAGIAEQEEEALNWAAAAEHHKARCDLMVALMEHGTTRQVDGQHSFARALTEVLAEDPTEENYAAAIDACEASAQWAVINGKIATDEAAELLTRIHVIGEENGF